MLEQFWTHSAAEVARSDPEFPGLEKKTRFYQASTSLNCMASFRGHTAEGDDAVLSARSPYAIAKLYGYWIVVNYREAYGMYVSNGILTNC